MFAIYDLDDEDDDEGGDEADKGRKPLAAAPSGAQEQTHAPTPSVTRAVRAPALPLPLPVAPLPITHASSSASSSSSSAAARQRSMSPRHTLPILPVVSSPSSLPSVLGGGASSSSNVHHTAASASAITSGEEDIDLLGTPEPMPMPSSSLPASASGTDVTSTDRSVASAAPLPDATPGSASTPHLGGSGLPTHGPE